MIQSRKTIISFVFSVTALVLSGCGGGSGNSAPPVPGNCAAGQVYSTQYGCLAQGNCPYGQGMTSQGQCVSTNGTAITSCQQTNQGPMVYTQYGCLPQGNCPAGQGAYVTNGVQSCIQAQMGMMGMMGMGQGCPMGPNGYPMVMTSKGCLPQNLYVCQSGQGFLTGRCYNGSVGVSVGVNVRTTSVGSVVDYNDIDLEAEFAKMDREEMSNLYTDGENCYVDSACVKKIKRKANKLKIKYYRHCR
ncbi:MAG: hypothetical protein JST04_11240 [Bdellovibrionales bacterium]|nr:hypothetical protein [Bdellovibrionales bacterium]